MVEPNWTVTPSRERGLGALFSWSWSCTARDPDESGGARCSRTGMAFSEDEAHEAARKHARAHRRTN